LWHLSHPPNQQKREKKIPKWRRPEEGWSKVNTDATFSEDSKKGATTSVIRDDQGALQAVEALWYEQGLDAYTMEALAYKDGLKLAVQLGLRRVQLESDCIYHGGFGVQGWPQTGCAAGSTESAAGIGLPSGCAWADFRVFPLFPAISNFFVTLLRIYVYIFVYINV
jgi:hypothetical protein